MAVKPATQLFIAVDGSTVRCGQCGQNLGYRNGHEAGGYAGVSLIPGYTKPDLNAYHYEPTPYAKRRHRQDRDKAERGNVDAQRRIESGDYIPAASNHQTGKDYLHQERLRPGVNYFITRPGATLLTVSCIQCGTANGATGLC